MLTWSWIKLLICFIVFWVKQQFMMYFIQNVFIPFSSLFCMEVTYHLTTIAIGGVSVTMSYWVEKMQLSFCLFIKSAHQFK